MSPVKHLETQIDNGGIQADQFVLESKLPLPGVDLTTAPLKEFQKYKLIQFPGTMFVGIGQSGMGGGTNTQMFELTFTASETPGNLTERVCSPQLAE
jgi:hypothetical protein